LRPRHVSRNVACHLFDSAHISQIANAQFEYTRKLLCLFPVDEPDIVVLGFSLVWPFFWYLFLRLSVAPWFPWHVADVDPL